ncbi:hypothetical protein KI387_025261, partial [Taxus chinensis]
NSEDLRVDVLFQDNGLSKYFLTAERDENFPFLKEDDKNQLWIMKFDGSRSNLGVGGFLTYPSGELFPFAYKLQFVNINNIVEYDSLLLKMDVVESIGIKKLKCLNDVEAVVKQVRDQYQVKNPRLEHYGNRVWDCIDSFEVFSIQDIHHEKNEKVDSLTVLTSLMTPHPAFNKDK